MSSIGFVPEQALRAAEQLRVWQKEGDEVGELEARRWLQHQARLPEQMIEPLAPFQATSVAFMLRSCQRTSVRAKAETHSCCYLPSFL